MNDDGSMSAAGGMVYRHGSRRHAVRCLLILALSVIPFWKHLSQAGYSGAWALLAILPLLQ